MKKHFLLWITALFCTSSLLAQEFQMRHFGVNEGLPSSQVYDIQQAPSGDLWIATDLGVSRYNGYQFSTFSAEDGLADNSIVKLAINDSGTIWMLGFNRKLSWLDDSAHPYPANTALLETLGRNQVTSLGFDPEGRLLLGAQSAAERTGYLLRMEADHSLKRSDPVSGISWDTPSGVFGGTFSDSLFHPFSKSSNIGLNTTGRELLRKVEYDEERQCWYVLTRQELWQININGSTKKLNLGETTTGAFTKDQDGNLWIGSYHGLLVTHPDDWGQINRILVQKAVSALCCDRRNGIWIGTFSDGVYHIKNLHMVHFRSISGTVEPDVKCINPGKDGLYFSDTRKGLYRLQYQNWIKSSAELYLQAESAINAIYSDRGEDHLLTNSVYQREPFSSPISGLCIVPGKVADEYWVGHIYSFGAYRGDQEYFNSAEIGFQERVNCLHYNRDQDLLWLGTLSGLYTFSENTVNLFPGTEDIRIDQLLWHKGKLWMATQGRGIGIVQGDSIRFIGKGEGLPSSFVHDLKAHKDRLLVATNKGLVLWKDSVIRTLNLSDGLISNEINCLTVHRDNLFLGTRKGLTVMDLNYLDKTVDQLPLEAYYSIGEAWNDPTSSIHLPPSENSISFRLLARDYRIEDEILYRYRLKPDTSWNYSTQQDISYSALSSGSYTFIAEAQNEAGVWSENAIEIAFVVDKPFWQEWWFILILVLLIAGAVRLFIRRQVNKVRKENFLHNQLNSLKIKALSAQMNPHFIFNSLNSIQNFLIENDLKRSNKYLTKFAKLMRLVLNNSDKTFSPFREVVHSLELYMELERIRFNEQFEFSIKIDPKVDIEGLKIPAMLMQPFVENAILHGILPRQEKGNIEVSINRSGPNALSCSISDDGVGREFHAGKQSKKFKSQGLRITKERLEAFQAIFDDQFSYEIIDLKNDAGEPIGTRVELLIPCR